MCYNMLQQLHSTKGFKFGLRLLDRYWGNGSKKHLLNPWCPWCHTPNPATTFCGSLSQMWSGDAEACCTNEQCRATAGYLIHKLPNSPHKKRLSATINTEFWAYDIINPHIDPIELASSEVCSTPPQKTSLAQGLNGLVPSERAFLWMDKQRFSN